MLAEFGNFSKKEWFYDIENILFYNVGTSHFKNACKNGLVFTEAAKDESAKAKFLYRYRLLPKAELPNDNVAVLSWKNIEMKAISSSLKPIHYWKTFKENRHKLFTDGRKVSDWFGLCIHIETPKGKIVQPEAVMKSLLDGIICALHPAKGDLTSFCNILGCNEEWILGDDACVLQSREYVHEYRGGIKWDPADDRCKYVAITVSAGDGETARLSGMIFEII